MFARHSVRGARYLNPVAESRGGRKFAQYGRVIATLLCVALIAGDSGAAESPQSQRERFQVADRSLSTGEWLDYADLKPYPLYPYLRYRDLSRRLAELPVVEVRDFLQQYAATPLAGTLRDAWLRQLARIGRWDDYLRDAIASTDPAFECWRRQALLATGQAEPALRDFGAIWLRGSSLPAACDPVIAAWRLRGEPSPTALWQRFSLAMNQRNVSLGRALRVELSATDHPLADAWLMLAADPHLVLDPARLPKDDARAGPVIAAALQWWGKRDVLAAAAALDRLKERHPTLATQWTATERDLALRIATDYHSSALARLSAVPEQATDSAVREWRVRVCLRQGDWVTALHWLDQLTQAERDSPRWQYWRGRVLELLGRTEEARRLYQTVALQRDYHGFLAAERIGVPYTVTATPLTSTATELEMLLATSPGLARARELYILGRETEAEAEWRQVLRGLDRTGLQRAALLAHRWDWHPQAIATIARADYWDDLELRFPLAYRDQILTNARARALDPAWVYGIIRQESGFRAVARSPVGALGLMQMLPATAQEMAKLVQDSTEGLPERLLEPDTNIRLGVGYLQKLLGELQENPVLATAAYNAGPNKVKRWLPTGTALSADLWAETIPYQETRGYVQRVMEYATLYAHRLGLGESIPPLGSRMKPIQPAPVMAVAGHVD
jgi:soluble lytic murein transglycosylase